MKRNKVKTESIAINIGPDVSEALSLPALVQINHVGFWITDENGKHVSSKDEKCERNSVMLAPTCLLYVYKIALRHLLLSLKVITPQDVDAANLVPHIRVRKDNKDPFSKYGMVEGKKFIIDEMNISVKKDFLTIEINERNDLHCTLIFSKRIKDRVDLLEAFKTVLRILNSHPELIESYSKLDYFAEHCSEFWYENPKDYPFNVDTVPKEYKTKNPAPNFDDIHTTPAGSIIVKKFLSSNTKKII